ncbi:PriCT-2 domain-containing protein, partial [Enterococcus faecium]|uniref:PriCT-2 domain-containing protein n=1 Tax=Enterococcus faecium TaxID=1352 RepID=UPI003DA511E7
MSDSKILDALQAVPPASCSYEEWLEIGMALREEGFSVSDWDLLSRSDSRYKKGV